MSNVTTYRATVSTRRGDASTAVRHGDVVLVSGPAGPEVLAHLQAVVAEVADTDEQERGRVLGRRLLEVTTRTDAAALPDFAAVSLTRTDAVAVVYGGMEVSWDAVDRGTRRLTAAEAPTGWVDRVIPDVLERVRVGHAASNDEQVHASSDLREGVVPAAAITLVRGGEGTRRVDPPTGGGTPVVRGPATPGADRPAERHPRSDPEPEPTEPLAALGERAEPVERSAPRAPASRPPGAVIFDLCRSGPVRVPLPVGEDEAPVEPTGGPQRAAELVEGIRCPRDHFNHPQIDYCNICGIGFNQISRLTVLGPRPPLGVLVLDDGTTFSVEADYVLGREPGRAPEVRDRRARALPLEDAGRSVSRVHARITTRGWEVALSDQGSANGTYVLERDRADWIRLAPAADHPLASGTRIVIGHRQLMFQSHHLG